MSLTVAVLGAESTGKSTLTLTLADLLRAQGQRVAVVHEYLREFCETQGRTPEPTEQAQIAAIQSQRIAQAASQGDIVIADTTALMTAVYSDLLFQDTSLYAQALTELEHIDLILLTALDLPWQADGLQRDGPHVREPVQTLLRAALARADRPYAVITGQGPARSTNALAAIEHHRSQTSRTVTEPPTTRWRWLCEHCSDGDCERHTRAWQPPR